MQRDISLLFVKFFENDLMKTNETGNALFEMTQVGSPAVRLRLVRCTAWVKRWSEAMDFFQTIFETNISLSGIFENYIIKS